MNLFYIFQIVLSIVCLLNFSMAAKAMDYSNAITGASTFILEDIELARLMDKATQGDSLAAMKISRHYSLGINNQAKAQRWLTIAAGLENSDSQYELASDLFENNDLLEADYWAKLAAANNNVKAKNLVKKIKDKIGLKPEVDYISPR